MSTPLLAVIKAAREANEAEVASILAAADAPAVAATAARVEGAAAPEAAAAAAEAAKGVKATFELKGVAVSDGVIVAIGGSVNVDSDDDAVAQRALIDMSYDFCARGSRTFKGNHTDEIKADLVESWTGAPILRSGKTLAKGEAIPKHADDPIIGINIEKGKATHWFVGIRPEDPALLDEAAKGELTLSWAGYVKREEA